MPTIPSKDIGAPPDLDWVPVDQILVDHNYQRELKPWRVRQILRDFTWSQFQPVMLAKQPDGKYHVYDGQHRVEAARQHPRVKVIPAAIVQLNGQRNEAGAFLGVNVNRTTVTSVERYYAGLEAGDSQMMAVCSVLEEAGCEVVAYQGGQQAPNQTTAVTAVARCIKHYGEKATTSACSTLVSAWPSDKSALKGILITAIARLYRANDHLDHARLVDILADQRRSGITTDAESMRQIAGGDASTSIAKAIAERYNRGLRSNIILIGAKK